MSTEHSEDKAEFVNKTDQDSDINENYSLVDIWRLVRADNKGFSSSAESFGPRETEIKLIEIIRWLIWKEHDNLTEIIQDRRFLYLMKHLRKIYSKRNQYMYDEIISQMNLRGSLEKNFASNSFFAHGAYVSDLPRIIEDGGLMSPVARILRGSLDVNKEVIPRWQKYGIPNHPDSTAVFFYHWEDAENNPGSYVATGGDSKGITDLSIFFPANVLVQTANCFVIKNSGRRFSVDQQLGEIAFTNSIGTQASGELIQDNTDSLCLPFSQAYLVIGRNKEEAVRQMLDSAGYDEDWQQEHLLVINSTIASGTIEDLPISQSSARVLRTNRKAISDWLETRDSIPSLTARFKREPVQNSPYFAYGDVFTFVKDRHSKS